MENNHVKGGRKAAAKLLEKDPEHFSKLGKKAQEAYMELPPSLRKPRGFAYLKLHNPQRLKELGSKGGKISQSKVDYQ